MGVRRWTRYKAHFAGVWANFFRYSTGLSVPPCLGVWLVVLSVPFTLYIASLGGRLPVRRHKTRSAPRGNILSMKVATGTVVDGKVVVEGETLAEGSTVTVVLREDDETFELTPEDEAELLESIAAIERGEFISGEQLLERLRRFG